MNEQEAQEAWEAYFYPDTIRDGYGTLRNRFGLKSSIDLRIVEYKLTVAAAEEWRTTEHPDLGWGQDRAKAIHRHLFQEVYEWAGEYRTVPLRKDESLFAPPAEIGEALDAVDRFVRSRDWATADRAEFARDMAVTFAWVNAAHPFREGNGRMTKLFLDDVAKQSPWRLDLRAVTPQRWNKISGETTLREDRSQPDPVPMMREFSRIARQRDTTAGHEAGPSVSPAVRASYPYPPRAAQVPPPSAADPKPPTRYGTGRGYGR